MLNRRLFALYHEAIGADRYTLTAIKMSADHQAAPSFWGSRTAWQITQASTLPRSNAALASAGARNTVSISLYFNPAFYKKLLLINSEHLNLCLKQLFLPFKSATVLIAEFFGTGAGFHLSGRMD